MTTSISSLLKRFDEGDQRTKRIAQLYRGTIEAIRDNLVVTRPGARKLLRVRFDRLLARIQRWTGGDPDISETLLGLTEILADYRATEERAFSDDQQQLRRTVAGLSSLAEGLRERHRERGEELEAVAMMLEGALFEPDMRKIHEVMQSQIRALKSTLVSLSETSFSAVNMVAGEAEGLQRLASRGDSRSEAGAGAGPSVEEELRAQMTRFEVFSVLVVELGGLDELEHAWGNPARDQAFGEFQKRVERGCSDGKGKALWHGLRALVISNSASALAGQRLLKLRTALAEPYHLTCPLGHAELRLPLRTGMVEYRSGETTGELLERADQSLTNGLDFTDPGRN